MTKNVCAAVAAPVLILALAAPLLGWSQTASPPVSSSVSPSVGDSAPRGKEGSPTTPTEGTDKETPVDWTSRSIWTLELRSLDGQPVKLSTYEGKVALVVNVASRCGYTPQYSGLEKLALEFKDRGLVVLGFPCNDFGGQEPGTPEEIREFCTSRFNVTFPLFEKVSVKPGETQAALYKALEKKTGSTPRWNFGKYLVSRDGVRAQFFDSKVAPDSKELREVLERLLAEAPPEKGK